MSTIFPGNYVAHLNAYREQGVEALPGVEFYKAVGAIPLNPDVFNAIVNGELPALTDEPVYILSPDLRQDDKPRKDKPLVVPANSVVYRTAISAPGVREIPEANGTYGGDTTIVMKPSGTNAPTSATLTFDELDGAGDETGYAPAAGSVSALEGIVDGTAISTSADTPVTITTDAPLVASLDPSAGACRNSPSAILVEVCYYRPAPAPDAEDAHIPFAIEAGQGY
jgi:hypothetical protein